MILSAFGLVDCSPIQVSEILRSLRMSHSFVGGFGRTMRLTIDGMSVEQPVWPVVIDRVRAISKVQSDKDRFVYFVCDGRAALALSNVSQILWPEHRELSIDDAIKNALIVSNQLTQDWTLSVNEPSIDDYVNLAAKPSFLNGVQGLIYKITPYSKRKETQKSCIAYLAGGLNITVLKRQLKASLKLADILTLMDSDKAKNLREAVAALRSKPLEIVSKEYGVETFEILYVVKSYEQNKG